jgi:hypothetical protein
VVYSGGDLLHDFRGATHDYVLAELDRRKSDLKTQLVWVGAMKEPGITARTWRWVNGELRERFPLFLIAFFLYMYSEVSVCAVLNGIDERKEIHLCLNRTFFSLI